MGLDNGRKSHCPRFAPSSYSDKILNPKSLNTNENFGGKCKFRNCDPCSVNASRSTALQGSHRRIYFQATIKAQEISVNHTRNPTHFFYGARKLRTSTYALPQHVILNRGVAYCKNDTCRRGQNMNLLLLGAAFLTLCSCSGQRSLEHANMIGMDSFDLAARYGQPAISIRASFCS